MLIKKRSWDIVHKLEEKEKSLFLKKLTIQESFKVFMELYRFFCLTGGKKQFAGFNPGKIGSLIQTHRAFTNVK